MLRRALTLLVVLAPVALPAQADLPARVDNIFARFDRNTPGCAVGLGKDGKTLYTHGYGSANLEYSVPLTDSSVMESGSVAKQFTAAALVLLQNDGKLSLDDDIRKYLPEVPDFGKMITIRNLITHTSGLRDQWGLLAIEGRGAGTQVHSPMTTLDLVVHQKALNFAPGSAYLYSNTGYALASIIVARVSGVSFQAFTQERLFRPLGMTHTQWRDDFTRVVPNRATAYAPSATGFEMDMPFTNMIGNGGLLSTMSDLLKWNENFDHTTVGGPTFTETMQTQMTLTSGRTIAYALGVSRVDYGGVREVSHGGSTAGYRTFLARYPDQHVSVAVWCSNASTNPTALAHEVADLVLNTPARAPVAVAPLAKLTSAELSQWVGLYRDAVTDQAIDIAVADTVLKGGNVVMIPTGPGAFRSAQGTGSFTGTGEHRAFFLARADGDTSHFEIVRRAPAAVRFSDYTGRYASDELDVVLTMVVRDGQLVVKRRPNDDIALKPAYLDGFQGTSGLTSVRFSRDGKGTVTGFSIFAGRVLDVRFKRLKERTRT